MSKALIIKGASFAANAVEQITVVDPIPCTGITLNQSALTLTSIGATENLTATVAPVDTTDSVVWTSSDDNVVTVTNGIVRSVGVGSATITAYCGEYSAMCEISSKSIVVADTAYSHLNGRYADGTDLTINPPKDYVSLGTNDRGRVYYNNENTLGGYKAYYQTQSEMYPIPVPVGTKHISIPKPTHVGYLRLCAFNSKENQTHVPGSFCAKVVAHVYATTANASAELDIPVTADSFVFGFYAESGYTGESITESPVVTFT